MGLRLSSCSADYRSIDPRYGTLDDWDRLIKGVHDRGMKLMYVGDSFIMLREIFNWFTLVQDGFSRQSHVG